MVAMRQGKMYPKTGALDFACAGKLVAGCPDGNQMQKSPVTAPSAEKKGDFFGETQPHVFCQQHAQAPRSSQWPHG